MGSTNTKSRDGRKAGSRQPGPHETQHGAATPGQGEILAAGNVAEPKLGPTAHRAERPPSHLSVAALDALGKLAAAMTPGPRRFEPSWNNAGIPLADFYIPGHNSGTTVEMLHEDAASAAAFDRETLLALLAMARRTERLETELANYETNHGARCDAEQERYATIAESACRVLVDAVDRLREMMRIDVGDDLSDAVAGLLRDLSAHASAPGHEVPSLRAKIAARDAALDAHTARIAELLAQVGALTERRDALLALVASISQTTPLASELEGWEGQRAALVAEVGTLRARVAEAERERDEARAKVEEASGLCGDLLESLRVASKTSDGYRDAHAAFQRWAAKLAPDAIGDEQKRATIDARLARPPLDPVHVAVLRGTLASLRETAALKERAADSGCYHRDVVADLRAAVVAIQREVAALEAVLGEEAKS